MHHLTDRVSPSLLHHLNSQKLLNGSTTRDRINYEMPLKQTFCVLQMSGSEKQCLLVQQSTVIIKLCLVLLIIYMYLFSSANLAPINKNSTSGVNNIDLCNDISTHSYQWLCRLWTYSHINTHYFTEFIKGCGMYCSVYGKVHIKDPLLLIEKSSLCGGSGFPSKKCVNVTI